MFSGCFSLVYKADFPIEWSPHFFINAVALCNWLKQNIATSKLATHIISEYITSKITGDSTTYTLLYTYRAYYLSSEKWFMNLTKAFFRKFVHMEISGYTA